jgi:hypothetical protein
MSLIETWTSGRASTLESGSIMVLGSCLGASFFGPSHLAMSSMFGTWHDYSITVEQRALAYGGTESDNSGTGISRFHTRYDNFKCCSSSIA